MILTKKFIPVLLIVALASINNIAGQKDDGVTDDPSTTTTTTTVETTTTTTTDTTTTAANATTTTTEPPTTTTTTTTTAAPTTTTTTTEPPPTTTTTAPPVDKIFNFTLPKNESLPTCLRLKFSLAFDIVYTAEFNNTKFNSTVNLKLDNFKDYDGICNDSLNTFALTFDMNKDEWQLTLNYALKNKNEYSLDSAVLKYVADPALFGNITKDESGKTFESRGASLDQFPASKGNSFKCSAQTKFALDSRASLEFKNYQGQPFISPDSKSKDFDTAIECPADTSGTSKLVPIIVGSSLAVLVILVLIAYIVGRHKHRNGYQTV